MRPSVSSRRRSEAKGSSGMLLNVSVTRYRHLVTAREVGLTRDTHTVSRLRDRYVPAWFANPVRWIWPADLTASPGFQWYVDKYAEVTTLNPWDDVDLFFQRLAAVGRGTIRPGALFYPGRWPLINTAAMASASEALAGWFCEDQYNWDLVTRPQRVSPDMVFRDPDSGRWALVEVKSSGRLGNPVGRLTTEMIKLLKVLAATKQLRPSPYTAALIMVQVAGPTDVVLSSLELEEQ